MKTFISFVIVGLLLLASVSATVVDVAVDPTSSSLATNSPKTYVDGTKGPLADPTYYNKPYEVPKVPSIPSEQVTGFRVGYWQCYDGAEDGGKDNCKPSEFWQKLAVDFCANRCSKESGKCGVNSFSVSYDCTTSELPQATTDGFSVGKWECQDGSVNFGDIETNTQAVCKTYGLWKKEALDFCSNRCSEQTGECGVKSFATLVPCTVADKPVVYKPVEKTPKISIKPKVTTPTETIGDAAVCTDSCSLAGKCYPFGYRKSGMFCSDEGKFTDQLTEKNSCENNFECSSNVCVNNACVSPGVMQKMLSWFDSLFG